MDRCSDSSKSRSPVIRKQKKSFDISKPDKRAKSMHLIVEYQWNYYGHKSRYRSRSRSPRIHDENKCKHYKLECYGDHHDELFGEWSRKYCRTNCESQLKKTTTYDEMTKLHSKQYRISRSRSISKHPLEENSHDEFKWYWSEDFRKWSKSWSRSTTPWGQFSKSDEPKQKHHQEKKSSSKSRSRSKLPQGQYTKRYEIKGICHQWIRSYSKCRSMSKSPLNIRNQRHSKSRSMSGPSWEKETFQNERKRTFLWEYRSHSKIRSRSRSQLNKTTEWNERKKCIQEYKRCSKSSSRSRFRSPLDKNRRNE